MCELRTVLALVIIILIGSVVETQQRSLRGVGTHDAVDASTPAFDQLSGRYIVLYKAGSSEVTTATDRLLRSINSRVSAATASVHVSSITAVAVQVVSHLSSHRDTGSGPQIGSSTPSDSVHAASTDHNAPAAAAADKASDSNSDGTGSQTGLRGVVLQLPVEEAVAQSYLEAIKEFPEVAAVIPDREVASADLTCVEADYLSQGISGTITSTTFKWPGCMDPSTKLTWLGRRCGPNFSQILYTGLIAVDRATGLTKRAPNGGLCVLRGSPTRGIWHKQRFGACGQPPLYARSLPTTICSPTSSGAPNCLALQETAGLGTGIGNAEPTAAGGTAAAAAAGMPATADAPQQRTFTRATTLRHPLTCGSEVTTQLTYTGISCGANSNYILWTSAATPKGCVLQANPAPQQIRFNYELFGSCGVPPGNATAALPTTLCVSNPSTVNTTNPPTDSPSNPPASSPPNATTITGTSPQNPGPQVQTPAPQNPSSSPPGDAFFLPRVPLTPSEQVPSGVSRIEAVTAAGVVSITGLPMSSQVTVGVIDSGIDGTHPDLNVVGGVSWVVGGSADVEASQADALTDGYGHGTHVAGIVAAKNNAAGVVGVSPGSPLYSLKVLDSNGRGSLSSVLAALNWVITEGLAKGIKVLNLSLAAYVDPSDPSYADTVAVVCSVFQQASDAGVLVTVAAGNYASNMQGYLPASCPSVAAVTAVNADGTGVSSYSNWLADMSANDVKAHVIAAPGTNILSTVSYARDPSGYKVLSGTSMAAPHVAGVAANCIMSGACTAGATGLEKLAVIQAAAGDRAQETDSVQYGFSGDASSTINGKYMGYLVWAGMVG